MKRLTVRIDERTLALVRGNAARKRLSLAAYVRGVVEQQTHKDAAYEQAMRRALSPPPVRLSAGNEPFPKREELY